MAKEDKYGLRDLKKQFPDDGACLEHIFDTLHTRECSCGGKYSRLKSRLQFQCSKCRFQIAPLVGTIFQKTSTPLALWFQALLMFSNAKSGLSAKMLERQLNVTYKTAWRMLNLIRKSLKQKNHPLKGVIEMDEGYIGGKGNAGKNNENLGEVMSKKSVVIAAAVRQGEMRALITKNSTADTIWQFVQENIDRKNTRLLTDRSNRYQSAAHGIQRDAVDHGRKEFVRDDIHVNNVESFWSHIKRSLKGTHKSVSKKHLQSYLDGFVWHRNNRHNDNLRFASLLGTLLSL